MQQSINSQQPSIGVPFENGAIPEEELDHVIGGLARAYVEQLRPMSEHAAPPVGTLPWDSATARIET